MRNDDEDQWQSFDEVMDRIIGPPLERVLLRVDTLGGEVRPQLETVTEGLDSIKSKVGQDLLKLRTQVEELNAELGRHSVGTRELLEEILGQEAGSTLDLLARIDTLADPQGSLMSGLLQRFDELEVELDKTHEVMSRVDERLAAVYTGIRESENKQNRILNDLGERQAQTDEKVVAVADSVGHSRVLEIVLMALGTVYFGVLLILLIVWHGR